jgi:hypothetical protein
VREEVGVSELVDGLVGNAYNIEMDDRTTTRSVNDADNSSEKRFDGIARHDQGAHGHSLGLGSFVQERPHVTRLVDLLHVGRQRDDYSATCHPGLLT